MPHWSQESLFRGIELEKIHRTEQRPLHEFSSYVIEELPHRLSAVRDQGATIEQVIKDAELLARNQFLKLSAYDQHQDNNAMKLARLDILMLDAAIAKSGGVAGSTLEDLVDRVAYLTDRPAGLTYEDIVINNPSTDIRTFTVGNVGEAELSFYVGHQYVEAALAQSIYDLYSIIEFGELPLEVITSMLLDAEHAMKETTAITATITNKMRVDQFRGCFRQYLGTHKVRDLKGPSGAFTASIPLFELYAFGESVKPEFKQYILDNLTFYPYDAQPQLVEAIQASERNRSVKQTLLARDDGQEALNLVKDLSLALKAFRSSHVRAAEKHTPEAMEGNDSGTGGEMNVPKFLHDRRDQSHGFDDERITHHQ